jgi:hypothetical protein
MDWREVTNEQVLELWDAGAPIWSCQMSGIGNQDYEQCIQALAFEMLRAMLAHPIDWDVLGKAENRNQWREYRQNISAIAAERSGIDDLSLSGLQFEAAMKLAAAFAREGYARTMDMVPRSRRFQAPRMKVDANAIAA